MSEYDIKQVTEMEDIKPDLGPIEYPCIVCGRESGPYSGRGRKPTKCVEHRTVRADAKRGAPKSRKLAEDAANVLVMYNGIGGIVAGFTGLEATQQAIGNANEAFYDMAVNALAGDPALCQAIMQSGTVSAKVSLAIAYGTMLSVIGPVAMTEIKARRAERAEKVAETGE